MTNIIKKVTDAYNTARSSIEREKKIQELTSSLGNKLTATQRAVIAKDLMGVYDSEILDAITYHTTGRRKMSTLEKIIYISDYIEPLRDFPGVQELRVITNESLDKGMLKALDNTITYVISKGQLLQKDTIDARNFLLMKIAGESKWEMKKLKKIRTKEKIHS